MKYDYLVLREQLATGPNNAGQSVFDSIDDLKGADGSRLNIEVMSISIVNLADGLYAYAACRIPEQRKAGIK